MSGSSLPLALVVIAGPQASGKSTIAAALCDDLRRHGERVALVALDRIAEMALPTLPSWPAAHAIFNSVAGQWARTDLTSVVAEGPGTPGDVADLVAQAPPDALVLKVVLTTSFEVAFSRAQRDPTRGLSRQHGFLSEVYERWLQHLPRMDPDVVLDTSTLSVAQSTGLIRAAIDLARGRRPVPH